MDEDAQTVAVLTEDEDYEGLPDPVAKKLRKDKLAILGAHNKLREREEKICQAELWEITGG